MKLLFKLMRKRMPAVITAACICVLSVAVSLIWNAQVSDIINFVGAGSEIPWSNIIKAVAVIFLSSAVAYGMSMSSAWACETMAHELRMGYARYFTQLDIREIENMNTGEQLSLLQNEIGEVSDYLNGNLFVLFDNALRFIGTLGFFFYLNPALTLLSTLPVVAIVVYIGFSSKTISALAEKSQQAKADMNGFADTLITLFPVIRVYDAARLMLCEYNVELQRWESLSVKEERTRAGLMSFSALLSLIPLLILLFVGGNMVINGELTLGTLYIFINLSGNVSGVMMNMPGFIASFRRFDVNMKRLRVSL